MPVKAICIDIALRVGKTGKKCMQSKNVWAKTLHLQLYDNTSQAIILIEPLGRATCQSHENKEFVKYEEKSAYLSWVADVF